MDHAGTPSKSGATALTGVTRCLQHIRVLAALCVGIVLIMSGEELCPCMCIRHNSRAGPALLF